MTRYYRLTSRLIRISDGNLDAVWEDEVERSVSEGNLVYVHFIPFHPLPAIQRSACPPSVSREVHLFQHVCRPVWFVSFSFCIPIRATMSCLALVQH
jgi:hypothetical protein